MKQSDWDLILSMSYNIVIQTSWAKAMKLPGHHQLEFTVKVDTTLRKFYVIHEETSKELVYDLEETIKKAKIAHYIEAKTRTLN